MRRIFLVRHGESEANVDKSIHFHTADHAISSSDTGIRQIEDVAQFLQGYIYDDGYKTGRYKCRLWTSPYKRTRQTGDGIEKGASSIILDRKEHINLCEQQFGLFDGLEDDELMKRFPEEFKHYKKCEEDQGRFWARMPLGESRFDVAVRVHEAFGTFHRDCDKYGVENIIVVCHGVTLRAFVMQWLHLTPEWFDAERNPGNCWVRLIDNNEDKGYIYKG